MLYVYHDMGFGSRGAIEPRHLKTHLGATNKLEASYRARLERFARLVYGQYWFMTTLDLAAALS